MEQNLETAITGNSIGTPFEIRKPQQYIRQEPKTGRNDKCPCGSGLKYKKCCGK